MKRDTYAKQEKTVSANSKANITFKIPKGQNWNIYKIEVRGIPADATVSIQYKDEKNNPVSLETLLASDFPLKFKKTATDYGLYLTDESSLRLTIANPLGVSIHAYVIVRYIEIRGE